MTLMRLCRRCARPYEPGHPHPECVRADNRKRNATKSAAGRTSARWKRLRLAAIKRDQHTCQRCGRQAPAHLLTVHIPPQLRNNHRLATLEQCITLCRRCHGVVDGPRAHG
jgi:5-methylcytosine-specific restriction endonuclease McrA